MLESFREDIVLVDRGMFEQLVSLIVPKGASLLNWEYTHISNKLYSVIYAHLDADPIKIVEESTQRCGFEAYRLLSRAYDRYTPETGCVVEQHSPDAAMVRQRHQTGGVGDA